MDAVSDTCHGVGYYLLQSGLHHFYGLSGYTGRMDLCVHVYIYAHIRWRFCLNLFWLFPKYLLKRHYMTYLSVLSVAMVIALLIQMVIEYLAYSHWPQLHARGRISRFPC